MSECTYVYFKIFLSPSHKTRQQSLLPCLWAVTTEILNPLGIISTIMCCISGASYPGKCIMALVKMPESGHVLVNVFIRYKGFYWSKAANDQRIGQLDALLENDVIHRVYFNENFWCQHRKVKVVYRQALLALASVFFQNKCSVIAIIFVISSNFNIKCIKPKTLHENSVNNCVVKRIAYGNMHILTVAEFKTHMGRNREMMCSTQRFNRLCQNAFVLCNKLLSSTNPWKSLVHHLIGDSVNYKWNYNHKIMGSTLILASLKPWAQPLMHASTTVPQPFFWWVHH